MTTVNKKHPPNALLIQKLGTRYCRLCISIDSLYVSTKKNYGLSNSHSFTLYAAHKWCQAIKQSHVALSEYPIWLLINKNEWVDVTNENDMLQYLLSVS